MPAGLYFLFANIFPTLLESAVALPLLMLSASVYYLSVTLFIYSYFVTFYLDLVIITNDRMVDIEQSSLFARTIAEVDLYQIQDATSEVKGFFCLRCLITVTSSFKPPAPCRVLPFPTPPTRIN